MPYPEAAVPRFGDWDGDEDLSYSIVFDKARADKERFLSTKDTLHQQWKQTTPGPTAARRAPNALLTKTVESGSRGSAHSSPKLLARHVGRLPDEQRNMHVDPTNVSDSRSLHSTSKPSSGRQPNVLTKTKEKGFYTSGSYNDTSHEAFHKREQGVLGPARQMRQEHPAAARRMRSHGSSETSSIADMPEKVLVPKFGDWDAGDVNAGDGFSVIFSRARDEKKSNTTRKMPARIVSPLPPAQDLYKDSHTQRKKRGCFNILCCTSNVD